MKWRLELNPVESESLHSRTYFPAFAFAFLLEWISKEFLPKNRQRLKAAHTYLTGELSSMGIPFLDSSAALYVWADFRKVTLALKNT